MRAESVDFSPHIPEYEDPQTVSRRLEGLTNVRNALSRRVAPRLVNDTALLDAYQEGGFAEWPASDAQAVRDYLRKQGIESI